MKQVIAHWVEMRTYEFPEDAPIESEGELFNWIDKHPDAQGDWEYFATTRKTRDWEIVERTSHVK